MPAAVWQQLPDEGDRLHAVAAGYYGSESILPVSGSQAAIESLPRLRAPGRVGILSPAYAEYGYQWQRHGHSVAALNAAELEARLPQLDVVVVIRPNNPTAECLSAPRLLRWLAVLRLHGGWLVVDEAFLDASPDSGLLSLIGETPREGLIVLRSVGKFFGLAGIRLGFVWASAALLEAIAELQPVWSVSSVARWAGAIALEDSQWQTQMRRRLGLESRRLEALLLSLPQLQLQLQSQLQSQQGSQPQQQPWRCASTPLFCTVSIGDGVGDGIDDAPPGTAAGIFRQLAERGVLIRYFEQSQPQPQPQLLRLGLPANEHAWQRLGAALSTLVVLS
ncbi:MAG: cobalamin biosynthetic protein CobC [Motiliproteus sp.]